MHQKYINSYEIRLILVDRKNASKFTCDEYFDATVKKGECIQVAAKSKTCCFTANKIKL